MDDLTARLADIFRHYMFDFHRMALMSEAELEEVTEPFRSEVEALIAEHGRDAVVRAALLLPAALSINHRCGSFLAPRRDNPYRSGRSKTWLKVKNPAAPGVTRFEREDI
jgi:hypothetical protein